MEVSRTRLFFRYAGLAALLSLLFAFTVFVTGDTRKHLLGASLLESIPRAEPMPAPQEVRAIYATARTVANKHRVDELIAFAHATDMNAMVVNVKDGDGLYLDGEMSDLAHRLRAEGIYPIARVVVFQDNYLARMWPEEALKTASGTLWRGNGALWMDPASRPVWDYTVEAAIEALDEGFAEVNFDYVRFPADGDLHAIVYPAWNGTSTKAAVIDAFSKYLTENVKRAYPKATLSLDIFAHSLLDAGDVGIGQHFVDLVQYFDVICPMTYPSHYAPGNFGFQNPAEAPYEVVKGTLDEGTRKLEAVGKTAIIRPWLQDFNMGAEYTRARVQDEIRAVSDAGYKSGYMMWNPSNRYDKVKYIAGSETQAAR